LRLLLNPSMIDLHRTSSLQTTAKVRLDFLKEHQQAGTHDGDDSRSLVMPTGRRHRSRWRFKGSHHRRKCQNSRHRVARTGAKFVDTTISAFVNLVPIEVIAYYHKLGSHAAGPGIDTSNPPPPPPPPGLVRLRQIAKVSTHVNRCADNRRIFDALPESDEQTYQRHGMGDIGQIHANCRPVTRQLLS